VTTTLTRLTRLTVEPAAASDGILLDAFLAGDQGAFAALVRRHAGLVFSTCRRILRHQQDAEDAFQATFLVLARRAADVWPREAVASWLFGVAHRVALKARERRNRRAGREQALEDVAATETARADFDLVEAVHRVIGKLPVVYRAAVVACDLEGLSRKEAAERLGWREGTLSGRLARARELLAARLRRLGYALPASGLAALATTETASATTIQSTVELATGSAIGVSASVATLTEGMVRSMALFKLKAVAAVVLTACALGAGVFAAASGTGGSSGDDPGSQKAQSPSGAPAATKPADPPAEAPPAARPKRPRVEVARRELEVLLQGLELAAIAGKVDKQELDRVRARIRAADRLLDPNDLLLDQKQPAAALTDRDRLQGKWRVVSLTENGKTTPTNSKDPWEVQIVSRTIRMPYLEGGKEWKHREYVFDVNEVVSPRTIDLIAPGKPVGRGIYEFIGGFVTCSSCHNHPFIEEGAPPPLGEMWTLCEPARKDERAMRDAGVRLALSIDGKRPTKFGGDGVIVFEMRRADEASQTRWVGNPSTVEKFDATDIELQLLLADIEHKLRNKRIDPLWAEQLRLRLESARWMLGESRKASGVDSPTDPVAKAELDLVKARRNLEQAEAELERSQATVAEARRRVEKAKDDLKAAEVRFAGAKKPQPGAPAGEVFTIHVRTLTAAEKVIRVKATGKETVVDALAHAADDVPIKADAASVWVVRNGSILPVDLAAITKGDAKTNHALKPGDQLFVQAKAGK
jgi:RNA polymerase sigma factor (sigma-70 family)